MEFNLNNERYLLVKGDWKCGRLVDYNFSGNEDGGSWKEKRWR